MGGKGGRGFRQIFHEKRVTPLQTLLKIQWPPFRPREKVGNPAFFFNISLHAI